MFGTFLKQASAKFPNAGARSARPPATAAQAKPFKISTEQSLNRVASETSRYETSLCGAAFPASLNQSETHAPKRSALIAETFSAASAIHLVEGVVDERVRANCSNSAQARPTARSPF